MNNGQIKQYGTMARSHGPGQLFLCHLNVLVFSVERASKNLLAPDGTDGRLLLILPASESRDTN